MPGPFPPRRMPFLLLAVAIVAAVVALGVGALASVRETGSGSPAGLPTDRTDQASPSGAAAAPPPTASPRNLYFPRDIQHGLCGGVPSAGASVQPVRDVSFCSARRYGSPCRSVGCGGMGILCRRSFPLSFSSTPPLVHPSVRFFLALSSLHLRLPTFLVPRASSHGRPLLRFEASPLVIDAALDRLVSREIGGSSAARKNERTSERSVIGRANLRILLAISLYKPRQDRAPTEPTQLDQRNRCSCQRTARGT
jgi:hypothetical protein